MDHSPFGKTIAIILVVVLIFLFPLPYIAKAVNKTVNDVISTNITEFTDTARQQGTITRKMYENMIRELDRTGELYDIDIEVSHPVSGAEIIETKLGDDMPDLKAANTSYTKKKLSVDDNYEEEQHEGHKHEDEIRSFATHTHTNDCYAGHRHTNSCNYEYIVPAGGISGFFRRADGTLRGVYSTAELGGRFDSNRLILVDNHETNVFSITEYRSGSVYYYKELTYGSGYYGDPVYISARQQLHTYLIIVENMFSYMNPNYGYGCYINPGQFPPFTVSSCSQTQDETPICNQVVTAITTTNPNQTVNKGASIITTATATYLDGHTSIINGISNFNPNQFGAQTVTLTYYGLVDNARTTGTKTCMVSVNVPDNLSSIDVYPKSQDIFLEHNPDIAVAAYYESGNVKLITGYSISGFNNRVLGTQTVTITYTEAGVTKSTTVSMTVIDILRSIDVYPKSQDVYINQNPDIAVAAYYESGNVKQITGYNISGFNNRVLGTQTVTISYTETGITKTATVYMTVINPFKLSSLTVSPASQEVFRYQSPAFSVTANYDNGTSKPVTGYSVSNYNSSTLGSQTITITYTDSGVTKSATANVIVRNLTRVCPICYTGYYLDNNDKDPGCPYCKSTIVSISGSPDNIVLNKGKPLNITVEATYRNGSRSIITSWTSNYVSSQVGIQDVTITYQTFTASIQVEVRNQLKTCSICSQEYELRDDGTDPGCPVCKKTVVSIDATPKVLTINKHQSLPITVKATYKDGHTESINDWASNLMADTAGIYEVLILYQNVMDTITVTVMEDGQTECPDCGLKYLFNNSPKGCPSCYVTLTGIEASLRSGGTKVPHKSKLNLQITKIFKDEHRELTYTGWTVSDYNPNQLGIQTITAHYNGFSDQLDIAVVDDLPEVTCPNGHTYYLNADDSDPGCPYCSGTVDKEESLFYFDTTYTGFIIASIYTNGEYLLEKGDYLKIKIKPRNASILSKLLNMFNGFLKREYTFGGEVS